MRAAPPRLYCRCGESPPVEGAAVFWYCVSSKRLAIGPEGPFRRPGLPSPNDALRMAQKHQFRSTVPCRYAI